MSEIASRVNRSGWPMGLIGMLVIVAATERSIARRDTDLGTMYSIEWRMSGKAVAQHAAQAQVLCLGTSVTRLGVAPNVLQERLGMPAYNLALSGGQPFASYTMLRHALAAGVKPKAVVVDFKWSAIAMDHTWNERVLPEMATLRDCAEFAVAVRDPSFLARLGLVATLPSYRCRTEIRANVMAAVDGKEPKRNFSERGIMTRNARVNQGGILVPVSTAAKPEADPNDANLFPRDWSCHPASSRYIHEFFALAKQRDIAVFWLLTPLSPGTQARRDEVGAEARFSEFVARMGSDHPEVTVVDGRHSAYVADAFSDTTHLNRDGAIALSTDLADVIAARLRGARGESPRWVNLPAYRANPRAKSFEDLGESYTALVEQRKSQARR